MTPAQAKKRYTRIKEWDYEPRRYSVYLTVSDGEVLQEFDVLLTADKSRATRMQNNLARALCRMVKQQTAIDKTKKFSKLRKTGATHVHSKSKRTA